MLREKTVSAILLLTFYLFGVVFAVFVYFVQKTFVLTTYSAVPASGTSRCEPARHGDLDAPILVKKSLM